MSLSTLFPFLFSGQGESYMLANLHKVVEENIRGKTGNSLYCQMGTLCMNVKLQNPNNGRQYQSVLCNLGLFDENRVEGDDGDEDGS